MSQRQQLTRAAIEAAVRAIPGAPSKDDPRYPQYVASVQQKLQSQHLSLQQLQAQQPSSGRRSSLGNAEQPPAKRGRRGQQDDDQDDPATPVTTTSRRGRKSNALKQSEQQQSKDESTGGGLQVPTDPSEQPIVAKTTLKKLADQLPGKEKLDADVEDLLSNIAEEFVREAIRSSARLSKHRKGDMLELKDVQLFLDKKYNISLPGFGSTGGGKDTALTRSRQNAKSSAAQLHASRVAEVSEARTRSKRKK